MVEPTTLGQLAVRLWLASIGKWRIRDPYTVGRLDPHGVELEMRALHLTPESHVGAEVLMRLGWIEAEWRAEMAERQGEHDAVERMSNDFQRKRATQKQGFLEE